MKEDTSVRPKAANLCFNGSDNTMVERTILLHKRLSHSDLADTVLQTGRIVLPRNQMEVNAAQIIDIANIGDKVINPDNGKATYELTIADEMGRKWTLLLKQWTANSAQAPRPIFVLERTSACMKAHRAAPGHILQAYITHSDPNTLVMTVFSPLGAAAAAAGGGEQRASAPAVAETPAAPQQFQHSNLDLLLSAATAYDTTTTTATKAAAVAAVNTPIEAPHSSSHMAVPCPSHGISTFKNIPRITSMPIDNLPPPPPPPPETGAGAGYVLGICQRSPECYKESGHSGFCSSGYTPSPRTHSAPNNLYVSNTSMPAQTQAHILHTDNTIDYLARHEDRRSPADALNAAAQQMQRQQRISSQEEACPSNGISHPYPSPALASHPAAPNTSYFGKRGPGKTGRKNPYGAAVNAPLYTHTTTRNTNTNTAAAPYKEIHESFPLARGGLVNSFGVQPLQKPQNNITNNNNNNNYFTTATASDTTTTNNTDNKNNNDNKDICPTWIVINYKNLRGDLHVPSMMVTLISNRNKQPTKGGRDMCPMSIRAFQLMAQTMHMGTVNQFNREDYLLPMNSTINTGGQGGGGEKVVGSCTARTTGTGTGARRGEGDNSIIMVEGAEMSLQRWLKSWDLPLLLSASPTTTAAIGGGGDGGGNEAALQTPPSRSTYHPYSMSNEPSTKRKSVQRPNSNPAFGAALEATELAIASAATAAAATADEEKSPSDNMIDEDESGSTDSDIEAGEVLLSMMGIIGGEKGGKPVREQRQVRERGKEEPRQFHQQNQEAAFSVVVKPQGVRITPQAAAQLYTMLVNEKLESQIAATAAATARFSSPITAVSRTIAMQMQLQHEATARAQARLDELSKRAKLTKFLACLSHIKYPAMQY